MYHTFNSWIQVETFLKGNSESKYAGVYTYFKCGLTKTKYFAFTPKKLS